MKKSEVFFRRQQVWDLFIQGHNQIQIAEKLNVSYKTVTRDLQELKKDARDWLANLDEGDIQIHQKKNFDNITRVSNELWKIFENTKDENKKIKILNFITSNSKSSSELMDDKHLLSSRSFVSRIQSHRAMHPDQYK